MSAPTDPDAARQTPQFTAVQRPGPPLTPMLVEERVDSATKATSCLIALLILAATQPVTVIGVVLVGVIGTVLAAPRVLQMRSAMTSLGPVFHEPLADDAREPLRSIVLRQLSINLPVPLVIVGLAVSGDAAAQSDGMLLLVWAAVLLALALPAPLLPRFVEAAQRDLGGELLYQRRPWRDSLRLRGSVRSHGRVLIVDQRDPARWGPEPS